MPVKIFFCYARKDEPLLTKLKSRLIPLKRQGLIDFWYDRDISAGAEWEQEISQHLNSAQIILLLVSPDFMASDYISNVELKRAIERHNNGEAHIIPIILRPVYWQVEPLSKLQALPKDGKPVTDRYWHNQDEAFFNIEVGIRKAIEQLSIKSTAYTSAAPSKPVDEFTLPTSDTTFLRSTEGSLSASISFNNLSKSTVSIFWLDYQGVEILTSQLGPGQVYSASTYVSHPWRVRASDGKVLHEIVATKDANVVIIH